MNLFMSSNVIHSAATYSVPRVLGSILFQFHNHLSGNLPTSLCIYRMS
jgi:hypothetical protein